MKFSMGIVMLMALMAIGSAQFFNQEESSPSNFESQEESEALALASESNESSEEHPLVEQQKKHRQLSMGKVFLGKHKKHYRAMLCSKITKDGDCTAEFGGKVMEFFANVDKSGNVISYTREPKVYTRKVKTFRRVGPADLA